MRFLTPQCPTLEGEYQPLVSIIVPARDEEAGIEDCLRSLVAQDYPNTEILVVDDRSVDQTPAIVERLARENDKIRLLRVEELPEGWTGKTHALDLCQRQAKGEWLLFIDADTQHHPSCIGVVLRDALEHAVEMESLLPSFRLHSFWERTIQPFAGICLMVLFPLQKVNRPQHKKLGFANGQFILVSRRAYDEIGGHHAVRDKFVEDIHLGRLIREKDLGLRVVVGRDISSVRMYSSLPQIVSGWSRILYSAVDFHPGKLWALVVSIGVFSVLSYAVLLVFGLLLLTGHSTPLIQAMFGLGIAHEVAQTTLMARIYRLSYSDQRYLIWRFLAVFIMLYILLRTIRMCRTHVVSWRGRAYGKEIQASSASKRE